MRFPNNKHVYRYVPDCKLVADGTVIVNRRLPKAEQAVVLLSIITGEEDEALQRSTFLAMKKFTPDKAQELSEKRFAELAAKHYHGAEGLEVDGVDSADFATWEGFCANAPRDIREEVLMALRSREILSEGEQKNFLPESDGP